ncbi:Integrase [Hoeflea sp. IMCC20628]|uniref:tyrosine-type recombinase/integrase n=1 Tax=Hoeflea sp. IMCC20628 TaxID=1620421 RepID=UPI00063AF8E2|nr:integrase arm-type DNA-binding domain-containing protein [Hoeflea sp. IMCC20628]AKI02646.1 Integrase [Hoeflea sp. IMCC20628]
MALTDRQILSLKAAEKPRKISDGGGLHLYISPSGGKLWRLSYRYDGKQKLLSFGSYPAVGLTDARAKREAAKKLLASDVDPAHWQKLERQSKAASNANTFEGLANEFLAKNEREGKSTATMSKKRWLVSLALPDLGHRPISDITASEVLVPLRKVEAQGNYETARRLRAVISQVFRYAIATAKAKNDPTFGLKGALTAPKVTHRAAFTDWEGFAKLIRTLWSYSGSIETRIALKLMALLYSRPGELRQAEWQEFDLDKGVWTIPAKRTKMRRAHQKPLSGIAIEALRKLQQHTGNRRLAFPSTQSAERPLSENTMNLALRRMGFGKDQATSHGFRASASTLLNESGLWPADAIEAELGHVSGDEVRRAYHRALYWDDRVKMAEWWAGEIHALIGDK